jgi:cytidyltransferase-like protein
VRILTIGSFGVPHLGHAAFLRASERFGTLTVGVNSDRFILAYRGTAAPFTEEERVRLVASLGYRVLLNDGPGRALIERERPDVLTVGTDWARRDYLAQIEVTQDELDEWGVTLAYVPMRPGGISSTEVWNRCR